MKKNQLNNHGLVKHSIHSLMSENNASSSSRTKVNEHLEYFESPYKGLLTEIKKINVDSDDDFRTTKLLRKEPKVPLKKSVSKKNTIKKKTRSLGSIQKFTRDNFKNLDVNSEQLQMAIALSNSTLALEYPERLKKKEEPDLPTFLSPGKIPRKGTILERYGFKSSKATIDCELRKSLIEEPKRRKNYSKFKYITPVLLSRNDEDRQSLMHSKISIIISQQRCSTFECFQILQDSLYSAILQPLNCQKKHILNIESENYYCKSLGLPISKSIYGCLLKNWHQIPGRDSSPERHKKCVDFNFEPISSDEYISTSSAEIIIVDDEPDIGTGNQTTRNCASPDLFESDIESPCYRSPDISSRTTPLSSHQLSTLAPNFKTGVTIIKENLYTCFEPHKNISNESPNETDNLSSLLGINNENKICSSFSAGSNIEYFESFCEDSQQLSKAVYDLATREDTCIDGQINQFDESPSNVDTMIPSSSKSPLPKVGITISSTDSGIEYFGSSHKDSGDTFFQVEDLESIVEIYQDREEIIDLTQSLNTYETNEPDNINVGSLLKNRCEIFPSKNIKVGEFLLESAKNLSHESQSSHSVMLNDDFKKIIKSPCSQYSQNRGGRNLLHESPSEVNKPNSPSRVPKEVIEISDEGYENTECEAIDTLDDSMIFEKQNSTSSIASTSTYFRKSSEMFDYNCTNALNVTDYVTEMLNSQVDHEIMNDDNENGSVTLSQASSSQTSIIISDEELNYSSLQSAEQVDKGFYNLSNNEYYIEGVNIKHDEISRIHKDLKNKYAPRSPDESKTIQELATPMIEDVDIGSSITLEKPVEVITNDNNKDSRISKRKKGNSSTDSTPVNVDESENLSTPNNNMIIKTKNITPMVNYDEMDTPKIRKELDKFGFKPLKRLKGIRLLKYVYESTHPVVRSEESCQSDRDDDDETTCKRRKTISPSSNEDEIRELKPLESGLVIIDNPEDLIFERKVSSKIHSCRIPLQVAWFNFVLSNPQLHNNILLYEPLHLEVIYSMLKDQSGCKFHLEDLISFLDKRCITFRTAQASSRRNKK